jgi:hypothetical protein
VLINYSLQCTHRSQFFVVIYQPIDGLQDHSLDRSLFGASDPICASDAGEHRATKRSLKMMKSMKRMILTGAAVMMMMSFAAPAMADEFSSSPNSEGDTAGVVVVDRLAGFMDEWF